MHPKWSVPVLASVLFFATPGFGAEVKNLKVGQSGDKAVATYDLVAEKGEKKAEVTVSITVNGQTHTSDKLHLTGAFGKGVAVGKGKKITWDVTKDLPVNFDWDKGEFNWNVIVCLKDKATGATPSKATIPAVGSTDTDDRVDLGKGVFLDLVKVPAGTFIMGSMKQGDGDKPPHEATISHDFWMGKFAVTQAQWEAVMGDNPSHFKGANLPVEQVSWDLCQRFISRLNSLGKGTFRLPTEAEWEYACRAGAAHEISGNADAIGWYSDNSGGMTHPVGQKQPNAWGLYDMEGNVAQWCQDYYSEYPSGPVTDPRGPTSGRRRVYRGGSWNWGRAAVPAARRGAGWPDMCSNEYGLRIAKTITVNSQPVQVAANGPSLEATMNFIQQKLRSLSVQYREDYDGGYQAHSEVMKEVDVTDPSSTQTCMLAYTANDHLDTNGKLRRSEDYGGSITLSQVTSVDVYTYCQWKRMRNPDDCTCSPEIYCVVIRQKDNKSWDRFNFTDSTIANRIATAFRHAVELCGGNPVVPEPF